MILNENLSTPYLLISLYYPPQHFFPNSLALNITCLSCQVPSRTPDSSFSSSSPPDSVSGAVFAQGLGVDVLGLQRQTLIDLQQMGPSAISEPQTMYKQCLLAGLLSSTPSPATSGCGVGGGANHINNNSLSSSIGGVLGGGSGGMPSTSAQRDALLSLILCHGLVGFLSACATGKDVDTRLKIAFV